MDIRLDRYADVLVNYSTRIKAGENVMIRAGIDAEPLVNAVYAKVLQNGAEPFLLMSPRYLEEIFFQFAHDDIIKRTSLGSKMLYEKFDAIINIRTEDNTRSLTNTDTSKLQLAEESTKETSEIVLARSEPWMNVEAHEDPPEGCFRWVVCQYPTAASAMDADMGFYEYTEFIYNAVGANLTDPVDFWLSFAKSQKKAHALLDGTSDIHIYGKHIDMEFNCLDRKWVICDGRFNMPDGEIFTSPIESSVTGWAEFTFPTVYNSRLVEDIYIEMDNGICTIAKAKTDEQTEFLNTILDTDEQCRRLGELAIATNPFITRGTKNILFDEKIYGTIHMAFGKGYPETGSENNDAAIHWDMVCDMSEGEITADGRTIYHNGEFA